MNTETVGLLYLVVMIAVLGVAVAIPIYHWARRRQEYDLTEAFSQGYNAALFDDAATGKRECKRWEAVSDKPSPECKRCGDDGTKIGGHYLMKSVQHGEPFQWSIWQVYCGQCRSWITELHQPLDMEAARD